MSIRLPAFFLIFLFGIQLQAQTKTTIASGTWTNPLIWSPLGVPTATNNVLINNGHTITFNNSRACNSLTLGTGTGGTAILQFSGNTALTLSVQNTFLVNTNGSVLILNTSNTTHSLQLSGDLINNGSFDMNRDGNSRCRVVFVRNGNQSFSGTGTVNDLFSIVLDMGTSNANELEISTSVLTVATNFLTLLNGTLKVSTPNAVTLVPYTGAATIPASAGIWLNSPTAAMSTSNSITLAGFIRVNNGTLTIGNANNEDLIASGGRLEIFGGRLNIAGKLNASTAAINFSMTGGSMFLPNVQTNNTTVAPFHISFAGSQFNMSGGSIILNREGGNGAQNLGFVNTSGAGSVTGGTLQFGSPSTIANQQLRVISSFPVPGIVMNSANITASVTTNTLQVNGNVELISGTLNDNNLIIGVNGNWTQSGGTYQNTNGTVLFNSASSAQSLFRSGGITFNNLQFSGAGVKTFSSAVSAKGFSISNGASVDVSASNHQLTLSGNFINSGNYNSRNGTVLLNGTSQQTLGGSSVTDFYNLSLNNTAGAILNSSENVINTLNLSNGSFNTNGQNLTLVSTASNTARVTQITGTGDLLGNVIVQRHIPGGSTGWAFLGSPISSALTFQDWDDDIYISCPSCPDGSAGGFVSVYSYNESATGLVDAPASYVAMNAINDPIVFGKGYWVYLGNGQFTTSDITLDVSGTIRKFNQTLPLSYNNYGSPVDDGWNLIHNPYPCPISWTSLRGASPNIDNAIYVYNADLNAGVGGYASFVNGISSPALGSGGIGDQIPMGQAFYVHSTGATSLNATEAIKVNSNPVFLKMNNQNSPTNGPTPRLRLKLKDPLIVRDECLLYIESNSGNGFDSNYDAYKLPGTDPSAPMIALQNDTLFFQINGIPFVSGTYSCDVKITTGTSGSFSIVAEELESFPQGTCIKLFDRYTHSTFDLRSGDVSVWLSDTTTQARFILSLELNPLPVSTGSFAPTCATPNSGLLFALGNSNGPCDYIWKNGVGQLIQVHNNQTYTDSLFALSGGSYYLEVNSVATCKSYTSSFQLPSVVLPQSAFDCPDSLNMNISSTISFSNSSLFSNQFYWDFGDGNSSGIHSPVHTYTLAGAYQVSLISESTTQCKDTAYKQILVYSKFTGENELHRENDLVIYTLGDKTFMIELPEKISGEVIFELSDGSGKTIWKQNHLFNNKQEILLPFNSVSEGVYYLKITSRYFSCTQKLLVF